MGTSAIIAKFMEIASPSGKKVTGRPGAARRSGRDARAFIVNSPDQRARWLMFFGAGLLIIGVIAFAVSSAIQSSGRFSGSAAPASGGQVKSATEAAAPHAALHFDAKSQVQKVARSLAGGAEAEAAIEQVAAMHSIAFAERAEKHALSPELVSFTSASGAGKAGITGNAPAENMQDEQAEDLPATQEVRELLSEVKAACENEDMDALLAMLDMSDPAFHARYIADAERLFRRFDEIAVSFSGIDVSPLNEEEVLVKAHVRVEGAFALTGSWMVLSNSDQSFTLRKHSQSNWKLCAVTR